MLRRWLALTYYLYALRLAALSHFYFNPLYDEEVIISARRINMDYTPEISIPRCSLRLLPPSAVCALFALLQLFLNPKPGRYAAMVFFGLLALGGFAVWVRCLSGFRPLTVTRRGVVLRSVLTDKATPAAWKDISAVGVETVEFWKVRVERVFLRLRGYGGEKGRKIYVPFCDMTEEGCDGVAEMLQRRLADRGEDD